MNELTTEQKAQRYNEILAMAKECITYVPDDAVNKYMLEMFPELKESEDEKIKQKIIKLVKMSNKVGFALHKCEVDEMIAWLEKQGEQILANSAKNCKDEQKPD